MSENKFRQFLLSGHVNGSFEAIKWQYIFLHHAHFSQCCYCRAEPKEAKATVNLSCFAMYAGNLKNISYAG